MALHSELCHCQVNHAWLSACALLAETSVEELLVKDKHCSRSCCCCMVETVIQSDEALPVDCHMAGELGVTKADQDMQKPYIIPLHTAKQMLKRPMHRVLGRQGCMGRF